MIDHKDYWASFIEHKSLSSLNFLNRILSKFSLIIPPVTWFDSKETVYSPSQPSCPLKSAID